MSKKIIGGFLKNKTAAYIFLFLSLIEVYALLIQNDIKTLFVFIFTSVITSYYYKDMSIILISGLVVSNIYKSFGYKENFELEKYNIDFVDDIGQVQECGLEAFENMDDDNNDDNNDNDNDDDVVEDLDIEDQNDINELKKVSNVSVDDTAKLANAQKKLIQNLKDMQPIIKEIEGFASKNKSANISDKTVNKLIKVLDKQQKLADSNN